MSEGETHSAFGMISANRLQSTPGAVLFDSDIQHQNTVVVSISRAERERDLNRDWIHPSKELIEVQMSEAQWASFVSSMNTVGVPCTLLHVGGERADNLEFAPRLEQSMRETHEAAERAFGGIQEALRIFEDAAPGKGRAEALGGLKAAINNAVPNVDFAGKSLSEHAENVVQKARADVEAIILQKATQMGIEAPASPLLLNEHGGAQ